MKKGLILGGAASVVFAVAVGAGFQVAAQAGLFWGLVTGALVGLFGLLAFAPVFQRL